MDDKTESQTPVAVIRCGGDLQLVVSDMKETMGGVTLREWWEVRAFDTDGNPLAVLGAFLPEDALWATMPTLVQLAREMYGPVAKVRNYNDFDLVAWRATPPEGPAHAWEWVGSNRIDETLARDLGTTYNSTTPE